ncbi:hypothetical protein DY000_02021367 [Brassica cretica]|uniref:Uncharacterized protein n=1 Tax=Brassica cretica TaxID=69181 RepID=A0ABQ7E5I1_BRACR|nr:hypothetical protein DY000_02021367 [Brassica cretica]
MMKIMRRNKNKSTKSFLMRKIDFSTIPLASTDIAYFPSIDTGVNRIREGDYSFSSWADDHHHESYSVETSIHEPATDEMHEGFTHEELLNMQRCDEAE